MEELKYVKTTTANMEIETYEAFKSLAREKKTTVAEIFRVEMPAALERARKKEFNQKYASRVRRAKKRQ